MVERADSHLGGEKTAGSCVTGVRPLTDAQLLAYKDSLIGQRRLARARGDVVDVGRLSRALTPVWGELLRRSQLGLAAHQPEPSDAFYVECSVPAGVTLGDYRYRGAAG